MVCATAAKIGDARRCVDVDTPEGADLWQRYLAEWINWKRVRTVAPIVSAALFTAALM